MWLVSFFFRLPVIIMLIVVSIIAFVKAVIKVREDNATADQKTRNSISFENHVMAMVRENDAAIQYGKDCYYAEKNGLPPPPRPQVYLSVHHCPRSYVDLNAAEFYGSPRQTKNKSIPLRWEMPEKTKREIFIEKVAVLLPGSTKKQRKSNVPYRIHEKDYEHDNGRAPGRVDLNALEFYGSPNRKL